MKLSRFLTVRFSKKLKCNYLGYGKVRERERERDLFRMFFSFCHENLEILW